MLVCMARMARDLANSHTLCESVNMTMKTTINFYDMTLTLPRDHREV